MNRSRPSHHNERDAGRATRIQREMLYLTVSDDDQAVILTPAIHHDLYGLANQRGERRRAREQHRGSDAGVPVQRLVEISARLVVGHEAENGLVPGAIVPEAVAPYLLIVIQRSQGMPHNLEHLLPDGRRGDDQKKKTWAENEKTKLHALKKITAKRAAVNVSRALKKEGGVQQCRC